MSLDESGSPSKWIVEHFTRYSLSCHAVREVVKTVETAYQHVEIVDTFLYGRCLFLDGKLQSSETDEFIYHESLVHPALIAHPQPERVLVVGGGEGATLREVLRHPMTQTVTMIDIDEELVELCRECLAGFHAGAFDDPKVSLIFSDARRWLEEEQSTWDVIIIDLPEPLRDSPASLLYTHQFYSTVHSRLNSEGILVIQAGTTHPSQSGLFASVNRTLREVFEVVRPYHTSIPSYQLPWGFSIGSKRWDPCSIGDEVVSTRLKDRSLSELQHYSVSCHRGMFSLPKYLEEAIKREGRVISDDDPFYWEA
jgi:spermidine synthase